MAESLASTAPVQIAASALQEAYRYFADLAEQEISRFTSKDLAKPGNRGRQPRLMWVKLFGSTKQYVTKEDDLALGWAWITTNAAHLHRHVTELLDGADDPDFLPAATQQRLTDLCEEIMSTMPIGYGTCNELDCAVADVKLLASTAIGPCGRGNAFEADLQCFLDSIAEHAATATKAAKDAGRESWWQWVDRAVSAGARTIHNHLKPRTLWAPAVVKVDDVLTASPGAVLQHEADTLAGFWKATKTPPKLEEPIDREAFPLASPAALVEAAKTFPVVSGASYDGFHPRQYAMLSPGGLLALALLISACERIGRLPAQLQIILFVLIPKQTGGVRPIALFASLYRVWTRLRRPVAAAVCAACS